MRSRPSRSIGRPRKAASCASPKSRPTTPTRFTGAKKEAATAKKDAVPPSTRSARPKGVSTVSYATLPTTSIAIRPPLPNVLADDGGQFLLDLVRDQVGRGHERGLQGHRALAVPGNGKTAQGGPQHGLGGGRVLAQVG